MIGCDGEDCEIEWASHSFAYTVLLLKETQFHMRCVGLTEAPKNSNKWYCDTCKSKMVQGRVNC